MKDHMTPQVYTRQQLYELVWQKPVRTVARDLGISDVALAKACRRLKIPLPGRGYWAKAAAGVKLSRIPLPAAPSVRSQISFKPVKPRPPLEPLAPTSPADNSTANAPDVKLSTLEAPHRIARSAQSALRRAKPDKQGLVAAFPLVGWKVEVAPGSVSRALIIVDTLLQILKNRGASLRAGKQEPWHRRPPTELFLADERVHVSLREGVRRRRKTEEERARERHEGVNYVHAYEYYPKGELILAIANAPSGTANEWRDGKQCKLEGQLSEVVAGLLALPDVLKERRLLAEEAEKQRLAEEKKRWEDQRARERDEQRLEELLKEAGQYRARVDLLAYLAHLEKYVQDNDVEVTESLTRGLTEARALADSLDKTRTRLGLLQHYGLVTESESRYKWIWERQ
jgi:hypothetical protein